MLNYQRVITGTVSAATKVEPPAAHPPDGSEAPLVPAPGPRPGFFRTGA